MAKSSEQTAREVLSTLTADAVRGEWYLTGKPLDDDLIDQAAEMAVEHVAEWVKRLAAEERRVWGSTGAMADRTFCQGAAAAIDRLSERLL